MDASNKKKDAERTGRQSECDDSKRDGDGGDRGLTKIEDGDVHDHKCPEGVVSAEVAGNRSGDAAAVLVAPVTRQAQAATSH